MWTKLDFYVGESSLFAMTSHGLIAAGGAGVVGVVSKKAMATTVVEDSVGGEAGGVTMAV